MQLRRPRRHSRRRQLRDAQRMSCGLRRKPKNERGMIPASRQPLHKTLLGPLWSNRVPVWSAQHVNTPSEMRLWPGASCAMRSTAAGLKKPWRQPQLLRRSLIASRDHRHGVEVKRWCLSSGRHSTAALVLTHDHQAVPQLQLAQLLRGHHGEVQALRSSRTTLSSLLSELELLRPSAGQPQCISRAVLGTMHTCSAGEDDVLGRAYVGHAGIYAEVCGY